MKRKSYVNHSWIAAPNINCEQVHTKFCVKQNVRAWSKWTKQPSRPKYVGLEKLRIKKMIITFWYIGCDPRIIRTFNVYSMQLLKKKCAILGYYAVRCGNFLPTFWDNLLVPSSGVENHLDFQPPKMGPIGCPETLVCNYHYSLCNNPEEHSSRLLRSGSLKSHSF